MCVCVTSVGDSVLMQAFSLDKGGEYLKEMSTGRFSVPYFVKASIDFDRTYPKGSRDRYAPEDKFYQSFFSTKLLVAGQSVYSELLWRKQELSHRDQGSKIAHRHTGSDDDMHFLIQG